MYGIAGKSEQKKRLVIALDIDIASRGGLMDCPKCGSKLWKNGGKKTRGVKQYKCSGCNTTYTENNNLVKQIVQPAFDWREWKDLAINAQKLKEKYKVTQLEGFASLKESNLVAFVGDEHIGNIGTDYEKLAEFTAMVQEHKIPFMKVGDEVDNFFPSFRSAEAIFGQILDPEQQYLFVESWLGDIGDFMLGATVGNHNLFMNKQVGFNPLERVMKGFAPLLNGIGRIVLTVGKQKYKVGLAHKGKGHSAWNSAHGLQRLAREEMKDVDLVAGGHYHEPIATHSRSGEKELVAIRTGTFKTKDSYAAYGFKFGDSMSNIPAAFFFGDRHRIVPFFHLEDALIFRDAVNKKEVA